MMNGAYYQIDRASVFVGSLLQLQAGERVLDLCAAPGGKTLLMMQDFAHRNTSSWEVGAPTLLPHITANELSQSRRMRMLQVLKDHLSPSYFESIRVTCWNGEQVGMKQPNQYDKILVDAPCSSERHLLEKNPLEPEWTRARTQNLAKRQYALLCSALLALKEGGVLVYSTCSISPLENDGVMERLFKRKSDQVVLLPIELTFPNSELTKYGVQIFPDRAAGSGPMYVCKLLKTNSKVCAND